MLKVKQADLKSAEVQLGRALGDVEGAEEAIARVSRLLSASAANYRKATPLFRRQINQAFFAKVFLDLEELAALSQRMNLRRSSVTTWRRGFKS